MKGIEVPYDKNLLVGFESSDDAGVYKISDDMALVQTVDFITPVVDDPYIYGQIAACNSLSDVYTMGGTPLTALNIVCFPTKRFSLDRLSATLEGGLSVLRKAKTQLLGGHSIDDNEFKYGLSVTGLVHPDKIIRNTGLKDGDVIILTKPLGTGIIATALKAGMADDAVLAPYINSMTMLNDIVPYLSGKYHIHACTDVTGFGLAGHMKEMIGKDAVMVTLDSKVLPVLPGAADNAETGFIPGGLYRNRDYIGGFCRIEDNVEQYLRDIIFDPQTSGGLLIAVSRRDSGDIIKEIRSAGAEEACIIGSVMESAEQGIRLV